MKISEVLGVTNFKPFSLGKILKKISNQKSTELFTLGGGGKNAKFHHLNLLGAALHKNFSGSSRKSQPYWGMAQIVYRSSPCARRRGGCQDCQELINFVTQSTLAHKAGQQVGLDHWTPLHGAVCFQPCNHSLRGPI